MKNLKKVLSLVLALAMALSLMTVAFAKDTDFSDSADIEYTEAVEVMAAIGVLEGSDGKFNPNGILTREQAAKIITYMLLGKDAAEKLTTSAAPFADVAADRWSAGSIAYCAEKGIIVGSNGKFNPTGKLTGHAFAKMLLVALGYDAKIQGYEGGKWAVNVASDAVVAGIDIDGVLMGNELTREQAAQMAFQTLEADMVKYASKGTNIELPDGTTVVTGASDAAPYTGGTEYNSVTGATRSNNLQFCEQYFSKLKKVDGAADDFGRPADHKWTLDGKDVFNATKDAVVVYSANLNNDSGKKQIASDLKGYKFNGVEIKTKDTAVSATGGATVGDLTVANSGVIVNALAALTANGKVVEIYADSDKDITAVKVITYSVEKINNVTTNKAGDVTYTLSTSGAKVDYADDYANDDTIVLNGTFAKNDYVTTFNASGKIYVFPTTKVTGKQTATDGTTLTIGGSAYKLGKGVTNYNSYSYTNTSKDANYFLDQFGYVVASSDVETDLVYAVVNKIAAKSTDTGLSTGKSAEAEIVLTDGTKSTVAVSKINGIKVSDTAFTVGNTDGITWSGTTATAVEVSNTVSTNTAFNGQIVSYVVDSDGKYELTFAKTPASVTTAASGTLTNKGVPAFGVGQVGAAAGTTSTVYVVKTTKDDKDVFTSYTGFANVPTIAATSGQTLTAMYVVEDSKVVFVYIDASANSAVGESTVNNIFYADDNTVTVNGTGSDKYYTISGILDGKATTIKSKVADFKVVSSNAPSAKTFYTLSINEDGYVTSAAATSFTATGTANDALLTGIEGGSFNGYLWNDKTEVYVIDGADVSEGTVESIAVGDAWKVMLNTTGTAAERNTIDVLYIVVA